VPCGDAASLADALAQVATDAALAGRLRAGGRAVVARHGWDAAALAHERAYTEFLAARVGVAG
jgi:glycosyltransferase involved in cell wall biosynthesis